MTDLQTQLFKLAESDLDTDNDRDDLRRDIQKLNAAELRHNIKVFRDADSFIDYR